MSTFVCRQCGEEFTVPDAALSRYPGWTPARCLRCRDREPKPAGSARRDRAAAPPATTRSRASSSSSRELNLSVAEVLERFTAGPHSGVFTDGACVGNPGPGGWGTVWVRENQIIKQSYGHHPNTTNNRMELTALIAGYRMLPNDVEEVIWSDSQLCVNTVNLWAEGWERRGWRRKAGPIKNLALVQEAYSLAAAHPRVELRWIQAHNGARWNEYADSLATAFLRDKL